MSENIAENIAIGLVNTLKIAEESPHGLYLTDSIGERVLLPMRYVTEQMREGDLIDLFVYTDSEDRVVATTERPLAMRGEFALMKVTDIAPFGAFVDWGLPKELLVPNKMQKNRLEIGKSYIVHVTYDFDTGRLYGDTRIGRHLLSDIQGLKSGDAADLLIVARTPLGYKVIANHNYEGMLYHNEIFQPLETGQHVKGYIKKIRPDGKLDLSLQPIGKAKTDVSVQKVRDRLAQNGGTLPFTYKSDAGAIQQQFGISKKAFKKALTTLLENGEIVLHDTAIEVKKQA